MSFTFTKLFGTITESSVWSESCEIRICWVTMLAMCDKDGQVFAALPGLARRANIPLEDVEKSIQCFLSPDPYSRTKDYDGVRIEEIDGGWRLLNYQKYRDLRDTLDRKEQVREAVARHRQRNKMPGPKRS